MKNKSPQRHSPEKIKGALAKLASGKALTDVAKELGISKGLLSYWKSHADQPLASRTQTALQTKTDKRSQTFIDHCWKSISLAFQRLDGELKKEKPQGIRDLALTVAVLADKMSQAAQNLRAQAAPSVSGWSVSEDTLMILQQHKEVKSTGPLKEKAIEVGLSVPGLEPQKKEAVAGPNASSPVATAPKTTQPGAGGGN